MFRDHSQMMLTKIWQTLTPLLLVNLCQLLADPHPWLTSFQHIIGLFLVTHVIFFAILSVYRCVFPSSLFPKFNSWFTSSFDNPIPPSWMMSFVNSPLLVDYTI